MTDERHLEPSNFEGAQLAQMRKWVESGAGADSAYDASSAWSAEDQYMRDLKQRVEDKLKQVGAVMQSQSGEAMKNQAMPVVLWTEVTADSAKMQSQQMTSQGEAFAKVQSSIPKASEEQSVPDDGWLEEGWDTMWTGSTDAEDAKAHNEKLRQDAVQAFSTYQETTQTNVSGSAVFTPPPDGGMKTTVTGSEVPSSGGVDQPASTSSSSAGGSGTGSTSGPISGGTSGTTGYSTVGTAPANTGSAWADSPTNGGNTGNTGNNPGAGRTGTPGMPGAGGIAGPGGAGAGRPGAGRAGSGSGSGARGGAGAGRGVGSGGGAGRAGGPGMGAGGRAGAGGLGGASGTAAGAGGVGGRGGSGMAGAGARGRGQEGEDDLEHETPDYLVGDQGVFDEDLPRVAPPVFGE